MTTVEAYAAGDVCGACHECYPIIYVWERRFGLLRDHACPVHPHRRLHATKPSKALAPKYVRLHLEEAIS